jgi:hypothetical protein
MFPGYAEDHTSNLFKFYNQKTRACLMSRNVYWLNKSYGHYYKVRPDTGNAQVNQAHCMMADIDLDLQDIPKPPSNAVAQAMVPHFNAIQPPEPDALPPPQFDTYDTVSIHSAATPAPDIPATETNDSVAAPVESYAWTRMPRTSGLSRLARKLTTSYNPAPTASKRPTPSEEADLALEKYCALHEMAFAAGLPEFTIYPQTLRAALSSPHSADWWKADTSFHLTLVLKLLFGLQSKQFNFETAFLYGTLDEEIYMQLPDGYESYLQTEKGKDFSAKDHCVLLLQFLYGLVQAAHQW